MRNFENVLAKHSLTRDDIDIVLLTHMHFDHACNVDLRPNATFVLAMAEWEYANAAVPRDLFIQESAIIPMRNAKKMFIKEDNVEIVPGITTLLTPGHTPGCLSFVLHQGGNEAWVLAGDVAKNRGELKTGEVQMSLDPIATADSIKKIKSAGNRILPGHDGWVNIQGEDIIAEGENDKILMFAQGVTVNGGQKIITVHMD